MNVRQHSVTEEKLSPIILNESAECHGVFVLPNGKWVSIHRNGEFKQWDETKLEKSDIKWQSGFTQVSSFVTYNQSPLILHDNGHVNCYADGRMVVTPNQYIERGGCLGPIVQTPLPGDVTSLLALEERLVVAGHSNGKISFICPRKDLPWAPALVEKVAAGDTGCINVLFQIDNVFLSGRANGQINFWSFKSANNDLALLKTCITNSSVTVFSIMPDNKFASGHADGSIKIWDSQSRTLISEHSDKKNTSAIIALGM